MNNPWADVPGKPPYIAAIDKPIIDEVLSRDPDGRADLRLDARPHRPRG